MGLLDQPSSFAADTSLAPVPISYRDHPPISAAYHITSYRHLPWQDLPARDNHPSVPHVKSGPTWRQPIGPVAPVGLRIPCRPTYPPGTLGGQYGRVGPSTQAH
ncbi:hypothetical protein TIFTF001_039463 [Ficus carica]|uniref:Uncharacterized protein n=1 Tax=Ficus carica TaxID=3494 RepID=A0AA88ECE0_FICCA|nr:hypothetical protein TIFTF001_039463 [Ficus carica]